MYVCTLHVPMNNRCCFVKSNFFSWLMLSFTQANARITIHMLLLKYLITIYRSKCTSCYLELCDYLTA